MIQLVDESSGLGDTFNMLSTAVHFAEILITTYLFVLGIALSS